MGSLLSPDKLREAREAVPMSQRELAERVGLSRTAIQNFESGRHGLRAGSLSRIAHALGVSMESLFDNGHPADGSDPSSDARPPLDGESPANGEPAAAA